MKQAAYLCILLVSFVVALATVARAADPITRSPRLPDTTPWNLEELSQPPEFSWRDV